MRRVFRVNMTQLGGDFFRGARDKEHSLDSSIHFRTSGAWPTLIAKNSFSFSIQINSSHPHRNGSHEKADCI
jgi:hypothetical protein